MKQIVLLGNVNIHVETEYGYFEYKYLQLGLR